MIVEFEYPTVLEDYYGDGLLKVEALFKILENAGNKHSDTVGDSIIAGSNAGYAWVLTDWYVEIDTYPKYGDTLKSCTWSNGAYSLFTTMRHFELYANGTCCARGTSRWIVLDLKTNRPKKIDADLLKQYEPEEKLVFSDNKLPKLHQVETSLLQTMLQPRRNDIDFNNHVHNLVYIDYAMEALPKEVYQSHNFKSVRIAYKTQVREGETMHVTYSFVDNTHVVHIYGEDHELKTVVEFVT